MQNYTGVTESGPGIRGMDHVINFIAVRLGSYTGIGGYGFK